MAPFILEPEEGPLEKIPWQRFPTMRGNRRVFESIAAPVSRELDRHADVMGAVHSEMAPVAARDINGDFERSIPGAAHEVGAQLGTMGDVDPARMYLAALESVGDLDDSGRELPAPGSAVPSLPSAAGSAFDTVQWAESGASGPPPQIVNNYYYTLPPGTPASAIPPGGGGATPATPQLPGTPPGTTAPAFPQPPAEAPLAPGEFIPQPPPAEPPPPPPPPPPPEPPPAEPPPPPPPPEPEPSPAPPPEDEEFLI